MTIAKDKIVILLGAGSVIEGAGVSTKSLTEKVIRETSTNSRLVQSICDEFKSLYDSEANFEDIYNIIELLYGYQSCSPVKGYAPQDRVFACLKQSFAGIQYSEILTIQRKIISTINEAIYRYDTELDIKGQYFKTFFTKMVEELDSQFDIYNLNYDTWVEQSLTSYEDGYIDVSAKQDIMRFDLNNYLYTENHRVSHLHGQIYFGFLPLDESFSGQNDLNRHEPVDALYKYKNYEEAKNNREEIVRSRDMTQNGHPINKTNIVTGMLKLDKILRYPLNLYFGELIHSLATCKKLIIIGYGFFDLYINQLLNLFVSKYANDKKIALIDYVAPYYLDAHTNPFEASQDKVGFSALMFNDNNWWINRKLELTEEKLHYSKDNNGLLCVKGFSWASRHVDEIINFLRN